MTPTGNEERSAEAGGHEGPVSDGEPLGLGVEGKVGSRSLGVVVGRGELSSGGLEATAGDHGGRLARSSADGGTSEHLAESINRIRRN